MKRVVKVGLIGRGSRLGSDLWLISRMATLAELWDAATLHRVGADRYRRGVTALFNDYAEGWGWRHNRQNARTITNWIANHFLADPDDVWHKIDEVWQTVRGGNDYNADGYFARICAFCRGQRPLPVVRVVLAPPSSVPIRSHAIAIGTGAASSSSSRPSRRLSFDQPAVDLYTTYHIALRDLEVLTMHNGQNVMNNKINFDCEIRDYIVTMNSLVDGSFGGNDSREFALATNDVLYVHPGLGRYRGPPPVGHIDLVLGGSTWCAGTLHFGADGVLTRIALDSGHYCPSASHGFYFANQLYIAIRAASGGQAALTAIKRLTFSVHVRDAIFREVTFGDLAGSIA